MSEAANIQTTELPDPDAVASEGTDVVIYDGNCRFCRSQVSRLKRFDWAGNRLSFLSLHDPRVGQRYADLSREELMEQMYVVDTRGNRHGGADAIRYLSRRLPLLWFAAPFLHLPGTFRFWHWAYRQVAKRRYRISGEVCENDACRIP